MHPQELKDLIAEGESSKLEFKRKATTPQKIAKEISAFANTKGGIMLVGVDDDGTIVGVRSEKSESDVILQACQSVIVPPVEPEIEIVDISNKDVIVVFIEQSRHKPHKITMESNVDHRQIRRAFIRIGEQSVMASREMSRLMSYQNDNAKPLRISIGDKEKALFLYLEKNNKTTIKEFSKLVNISTRRAERIMIQLVRAGVLQIHNDTYHDYFTLV